MTKRSFFERITGTIRMDTESIDNESKFDDGEYFELDSEPSNTRKIQPTEVREADYDDEIGTLPVDMYIKDDFIVVKAIIAGVRKTDLEIDLSRDKVIIKGSRNDRQSAPPENYVFQELYWGKFERIIDLPVEIDIEDATATEEDGMIILRLPKVDKYRTTKLRVE
jgi:HSP20 family protein